MTKFLSTAAHVLVFSFLASIASALPITGSVDIYAAVKLDGTNLGNATKANATTGNVLQGDGSYETIDTPSIVTFAAFQWTPASVPAAPLWSFTDFTSGWIYSFTLLSITSFTQGFNDLDIAGVGMLSISGDDSPYDPTAALWTFTITDADGLPNRSGKFAMLSNNSMVPESGTLVVFLGLVMIGLVMVHTCISRD